jgi:hypothetical protein
VAELEWSWLDEDAPRIVDVAGYSEWSGWVVCEARSPEYPSGKRGIHVECTRMTGHSGRHAASTGAAIIAVWL